eukprot:scaffold2.g7323.t1
MADAELAPPPAQPPGDVRPLPREAPLSMEETLIRELQARLAAAEGERVRLRRARDELAAALLAAEGAAAEAEAAAAARRAAAQTDAEILLDELDREREVNAELAAQLEAADAERRKLATQLEAADAERRKLEEQLAAVQQGHQRAQRGGRGASPLRPSASAASLAEAGGEEDEGPAALQRRLAALKASRDKLIAVLDGQAAEVEWLTTENAALAEALAELRDVAAKWEAQAQGALGQTEQLKDLLEESATWSTHVAPASSAGGQQQQPGGRSSGGGEQGAAPAGEPGGTEAAAGDLAARCQQLESELLLEKARSSQLDLQVRVLCAELTRAVQASGAMQQALLPLLGGVEARLAAVLAVKPPAALAAALREDGGAAA